MTECEIKKEPEGTFDQYEGISLKIELSPLNDESEPVVEIKREFIKEEDPLDVKNIKPDPDPGKTHAPNGEPYVKRRLYTQEVKQQWNIAKLIRKLGDNQSCIVFAEEKGLIPRTKKCRSHRKDMLVSFRGTNVGEFRCFKGKCKRSISRAKNTWFEHARMSPSRIFFVMYCFARKYPYEVVQMEDFTSKGLTLSPRTIADWNFKCRETIVTHFVEKFTEDKGKIGGPGKVVQIDESQFGRRNSNKGKTVEGHWVVGMIEDGSEDLRLEICADNVKSSDVLMNIINKHVLPGTTIHTDDNVAYDFLTDHGFVHKKKLTNDADKSVVPDPKHKHRILSYWGAVKREFYKDYNSTDFADWLVEFQWRREIKKRKIDTFDALLDAVLYVYGNHNNV